MKDVYYNPEEYSQDLLSKLTSNIKEDRTDDDLLFQSLIERGVMLNKSYRKQNIDGYNVIIYNEEGEVPEFIGCFDENISEKKRIYSNAHTKTLTLKTHLMEERGTYDFNSMMRSKSVWMIKDNKKIFLIPKSIDVAEDGTYDNIFTVTCKFEFSDDDNL